MLQLPVDVGILLLVSGPFWGSLGLAAQDSGLIPHLIRQGSLVTITSAAVLEGLRDGVFGAIVGGIVGFCGGNAKAGAGFGLVAGAIYGVLWVLNAAPPPSAWR
jgi:hypothetical protein